MTETLILVRGSLVRGSRDLQTFLDDLQSQIDEQGRYHDVCSITLEDMREHGYDVSEENCLQIERIVEKPETDADELWNSVEIWAETYGITKLEDF